MFLKQYQVPTICSLCACMLPVILQSSSGGQVKEIEVHTLLPPAHCLFVNTCIHSKFQKEIVDQFGRYGVDRIVLEG